MLKEKDLDIVEGADAGSWHALITIEAVKSGADVYCQKPISVDVAEGQAMLAAARNRAVVQIGTQRRSTPHLVEARDTIIKDGRLEKLGSLKLLLLPHARDQQLPQIHRIIWITRCGQRPRRCGRTTRGYPRGWRAFMNTGMDSW